MAELAHWDGWEVDIWLGWVEEEDEEPPVVVPMPTVSSPSFFVDVSVGQIELRRKKRKRLMRIALLLG